MKNNIDKQMLEKQKNRSKEKADVDFNKLLAKQKKPANPFDEARSYTSPSMKETKPGPDYA